MLPIKASRSAPQAVEPPFLYLGLSFSDTIQFCISPLEIKIIPIAIAVKRIL